jgi:diguanylate cyclase (GGDEF)-like protein
MAWIAITIALSAWTALVAGIGLYLGHRRAIAEVAQAWAAAHRDPLTGLLNRAGLEAAPRASRNAMTVALIDLDDFKDINDSRGHRIGDVVLIAAGHRLQAYAAALGGFAARLGGDEFVALLPCRPDGMALPDNLDLACLGADLHRALTSVPVETDGIPVTLSASVGLSRLVPTADLYGAIHLADQAMFQAKDSDTKAVAVPYNPDVPPSPKTARTSRQRRSRSSRQHPAPEPNTPPAPALSPLARTS